MKAKFLCCGIVIIMLVGCASSNKNTNTENTQQTSVSKAQLSNSFNTFWRELTEEADGKLLEQFIPSQKLIKRYSLREQNQQFFISGFLHTDSTFNKADIENIGGNIVTSASMIKTFSIPIKNIPLFIQIKGITYIEIGQKVRTKK